MSASRRLSTLAFVALALVAAVALVVLVAPHASADPDGLEKVSSETGIDGNAVEGRLAGGPLADYRVRGVENGTAATGIAGIAGIVATFAGGSGVVWLVRRRRRPPSPPADPLVGLNVSERVLERANQRDGALAHWCTNAGLDASHDPMVHQ